MQVGPDCTWVKSRMRTPSSALPASPQGLVEGLGRPFATAFFAAGLVSKAVLNLQTAHDLASLNLNGVYDLRSVSWLTTDTESGKFLSAMLGWDPRPSIEQVGVWLAYAIPVTVLFFWPARRSSGDARFAH